MAAAFAISLATVRLWAMFRAQVLWRSAVGPAWVLASLGLAAIIAVPLAPPVGPAPAVTTWIWLLALEFVVGTVIGLVATLPGYALLGAAAASAQVMRTAARPLVGLAVVLTLAAALALDLHQALLVAARDTLVAFPPGRPGAWLDAATLDAAVPTVLGSLDALLVLGLALATPALLAGAFAELSARLIARGPAPVDTALGGVAPWLRAAAAMIALGGSWAAYGSDWATAAALP